MTFAIDWMVFDGEWEDARAHREQYGPAEPLDDEFSTRRTALHSAVQLRRDEDVLFPREALRFKEEDLRRWQAEHDEFVDPPITPADLFGWSLHPIHLAGYLDWVIWDGAFAMAPDDTLISYRDPESDFYLAFQKYGDLVLVGSTWEHSPVLRVPAPEFFAGTRDFIVRLLREIHETAPELLDWPELAALQIDR